MRSRLLWSAGVLVALVALACQWRIGFNNDNAWLLYCAARVLDGARLYVDLVEINPPLIVWLNIPAVWLGRFFGVSPVDVFRVGIFLAALGSAAWCERLARRGFPALPSGAVFCSAALALLGLPVAWFGQREHLLVVLMAPYLVQSGVRMAAARDHSGGIGPLAAGVLAGLGLALKPQFAGIWLLVLGLGLRHRRPVHRWVENRAIVAVGLLYVTAVVAWAPDYLPLVRRLGGAYARYRAEGAAEVLAGRFEPLVALLTVGIYLAYRRVIEPRALGGVLALAVAGSLAGAVLQGKGFDYHYYPALALACVLLGVVALAPPPLPDPGARWGRAIAAALLTIVSAAYLQAGVRIALGRERTEMEAYRTLERAVGPVRGRPLLVLAPRSGFAFGLVTYAGARWVGRFPCLWLPPVLYQPVAPPRTPHYRTDVEMPGVERWFRDAVVADAVQAKPDVILVGVPTPGVGPEDYWFDFLGYFSTAPEFASLMRGYQRVGQATGYEIYRKREGSVLP